MKNECIDSMTTAEIIMHNYNDISISITGESIFDTWKELEKSLTDSVPSHPKGYGPSRELVFEVIVSSIMESGLSIPDETADNIFQQISHEAYLYNWGKTKTVIEISDEFVERAKEKYQDLSKVDITMAIFNSIPSGSFIKGNLADNTCGVFIYPEIIFLNNDTMVSSITMNTMDKLRLSNVKRSLSGEDPIIIVSVCTTSELYITDIEESNVEGRIKYTSEMIKKNSLLDDDCDFSEADKAQRNIIRCMLAIRDAIESSDVKSITFNNDNVATILL